MHNPALNPAILLAPAEDGYLAYDPTANRLHTLNPVAALIAELCDGTRSVDQIRDLVGPILPEGKSAEVDRWIEQGVEASLLLYDGSSGEAHRELTAKELFDLAQRLQGGGKATEALICARRVTELAPDNPNGWYFLAELAHNEGRREEERAAYEKYIELKPGDEEIKHILVALRDGPPPLRMPDECILQIYNGFASTFDSRLCDDLGYKGPERVRKLIAPLLLARSGQALAADQAVDRLTEKGLVEEPRPTLAVLDLGCGSGLAAVQFKPYASRMVGLDLSPEMINQARARNLYDRLDVAEITNWLKSNTDLFDLVLACDCLIYFGDLQDVTSGVAKLLNTDGIFSFTLESGDRYPFRLTDAGRYAHHPDHVREVASKAGLRVEGLDEDFLRTENGAKVAGLFVALKKVPNKSL